MTYCRELSRGRLTGGYDPKFRKYYRFGSPNNRSVSITPAIAVNELEYVNAGYRGININGGGPRPSYLNRLNHAVLFHPDYIQNYVGGAKPFTAMNRDECRGCVQAVWDSRNGYGVITSGAAEARYAGDPWCQDAIAAPQQYKWIEEKWAELAAANPGTINAGCYDGIAIVDPGQHSEATLRAATASPEGAHAFMLQYETATCPYFRNELWRVKPICLINQYHRGSSDGHTRYAQCRLTILIVQLARIHCGLDPEDVMIFCFFNKAEFTYFTTRFERPLNPGSLFSYDFTQYSRNMMLAFALNIRKLKHFFAWEDTSYGREGTDVVPTKYVREDGFTLINAEGSNKPQAAPQVSPFKENVLYPCLHSPKAGEDMAGLAGLWYQLLWQHVPKKPQNARYRVSGTADFCNLDYFYDYERWKAGDCWVEVAEDGNNYVIIIEDFVHNKVAKRTIDVMLPSGTIITGVTYKTGGVRAYRGQK
jgi:hypothetical protein